MRIAEPYKGNMSLSFSIDRILSPDFGPCKSQALDSAICSVEYLPEDYYYKKLLAGAHGRLEMPDMHAKASLLCQMVSVFPTNFFPNSKIFNPEKIKLDACKNEILVDGLILTSKTAKQHDLDYVHVANAISDDVKVHDHSEKQPATLTKVAKFITDVFDQKVIYDRNTPPIMDYLEQSSSLLSPLSQIEQSKLSSGHNTATTPTKETLSSPKRDVIEALGVKDAQSITKSLLEKDNSQTDETDDILCDTKPHVLEELYQNEDCFSSGDGRSSSSSVETFSSTVETDSNHEKTVSGLSKPSPEEDKIVIKESLSDACVDSPPSNFCDSKIEPSSKLMSDDLEEIVPPGEGWPVWVYCSRYSARPSSGPRSRRQSRKMQSSDEKRCRTAFTMYQLNKLHMAFESNPYLCERRRNELAQDLQLSESQVKIWFQNRRAKVKKATGSKSKLAALLKEQGLYNHSTTRT